MATTNPKSMLSGSLATLIRNANKKGVATKVLRNHKELWKVVCNRVDSIEDYFFYEYGQFIAHIRFDDDKSFMLDFGGSMYPHADLLNDLCKHFYIDSLKFKYSSTTGITIEEDGEHVAITKA